MNFLDLHILWHLAWVLPFMLFIYFYARNKRAKTLVKIFGSRSASEEFVQLSRARRFVKFIILIAALLFLFVAAARPYWGYRILPLTGKGRDMMIVLDVSRSMLSKDVQPSRLEHAKWFIRQLLEKSHGDRFGLIAFAGTAFLECPLTSDKASFYQILNEMKTDSIPLGGTNIQISLEKALDEFKAAETSNRAIILVTDGDELYGNSSSVIQKLKDSNIPIFVVGIGDPAQPGLIPVPAEDGKTANFLRDEKGELVKSTLNEKQLSAIALSTSGIYVRSTTANTGLTQILDRVKGLVPKEYDGGKYTRPIEKFMYPLVAGLLLLLCWFFISERKSINGNRLKKALMLVILACAASQLTAADTQKNDVPLKSVESKNQDTPVVTDKDKTNKQAVPNDPILIYNIAREAQEKNDSASASALYENAINAAQNMPSVRASSYQNLGVINHNASRGIIEQSKAQVKQQNLDGALDGINNAMKGFDKTEEMYLEAMNFQKTAEKPDSNSTVAENQQKLLIDRETAEKLKKMIEELKKQQQDAQDKTKQAKDQQQKENNKQNKDDKQQKNDKQNKDDKNKDKQDKQQNKQDEQNQDKNQEQKDKNKQDKEQQNKSQDKKDAQNEQDKSQKQDKQDEQKEQNKQQKQDAEKQDKKDEQKQQESQKNHQNQSPENALKNAQESVNDLKDKAEKMEQQNIKNSAENAKKELDKAAEAQKKHDGKKAEEHMDKALKMLGPENKDQKDKDKKDDNNKGNQDKKDDQQKDNKEQQDKQDKKDNQLPKAQDKKDSKQDKPQKDEKDIDPAQAQAILDLMAKEEKNLRDAIKERQKEAYGIKAVDKNW